MTRKIVITGGAGMLGTELATLLSEEYNVVCIDNLSRYRGTDPLGAGLSRLGPLSKAGVEPIVENISIPNMNQLVDFFAGAWLVINAAADVGGVGYNISSSPEIFAANSILQSIPVKAAQMAGVPRFIQISSVCVYEPTLSVNRFTHEHRETDPLGSLNAANAGYALAKRAGEVLAFSSTIPCVTVVRPTNMFGPHDHFDERAHVIPALAKRVADDNIPELVVFSHPNIERDFLSAADAALMIKLLIERVDGEIDRQVFNLPAMFPEARLSMKLLAESLVTISGTNKPIHFLYEDGALESAEVSRRVNGEKLFSLINPNELREMAGHGFMDDIKEVVRRAESGLATPW